MTAPDSNDIRHDVTASRFELAVEGRLSVVDYLLREGEMVITHTFVPPELRQDTWHPVILEEMVRKERENHLTDAVRVMATSA